MKTQTQKMTQIFSAFSAWAGRGLRFAQQAPAPADDQLQEYEAGVMPVIPQRTTSAFDERAVN